MVTRRRAIPALVELCVINPQPLTCQLQQSFSRCLWVATVRNASRRLNLCCASNTADRLIEELTGDYSRVFWRHEGLGSVQTGLQFARVWLYPWVTGIGPNSARTNLVFAQLRYNLP